MPSNVVTNEVVDIFTSFSPSLSSGKRRLAFDTFHYLDL